MCVMNEFLENRKPSLWAHEAKTKKAAGKMLFSEGPWKWGFDAFTLREGVAQEETERYRGEGATEKNSVWRTTENHANTYFHRRSTRRGGGWGVGGWGGWGRWHQVNHSKRKDKGALAIRSLALRVLTSPWRRREELAAEGSISACSRSREARNQAVPAFQGAQLVHPTGRKSLNVSIEGDFLTLQQRTPPSSQACCPKRKPSTLEEPQYQT